MKKLLLTLITIILIFNICFSQNIIRSEHGTTVLDLKIAGMEKIYQSDELMMGDIFAGDIKMYLKSNLEPVNGCEIRDTYNGKMKFCFLNGEVVGFLGLKEWYENGNIRYEDSYNGEFVITTGWYETGELEAKIQEDPKGWRSGKCLWFYKNGEINTEQNWEPLTDDPHKKNGLWKSYYESGQISSEFRYKNGKLHGTRKMWHKNGQLKKESIFKNGEIVIYSYGNKFETCWDEDGNEIKCE
jgi:antitoxin component YwqK of YwqJK toxin-antitoxin module